MNQDLVNLENLGRGACGEKFEDALKDVYRNILDPNTTLVARTITLKVAIKPDETRSLCAVGVDCKVSLAPLRPFKTTIFVGSDKGQLVATELNPNQPVLPGVNDYRTVYTLKKKDGGDK